MRATVFAGFVGVALLGGCGEVELVQRDRYAISGVTDSAFLWRLDRWTGEVCLFTGIGGNLTKLGCTE